MEVPNQETKSYLKVGIANSDAHRARQVTSIARSEQWGAVGSTNEWMPHLWGGWPYLT